MPHSSGGGSHGGGTHFSSGGGGSFFSSGGGGGSYSSSRVSSSYFSGASRYVYYTRRGDFRYIYADRRPGRADIFTTSAACIVVTIIAALIIWLFMSIGLYAPTRIDDTKYASGASITDNVGFIKSDALMKSLEAVQKKSGVSLSVEIVYDSEWNENYTNLEKFAYSEYLRQFDDELHWLFVVSFPEDYETAEFIKWSWEGMIGDDCYPAINSDSEKTLTTIVHKHLLRLETDKIESYLAAAFNEFADICMEQQTEVGFIIFSAIIFVIYVLLMIFYIKDYLNSKHMEKAVQIVTNNPVEIKCEYCGRMYVIGTTETCRGCGAPVHQVAPSSSDSSNKKKKK